MARRPLTDAPELQITRRAALEDWLAAHHAQASGIWVVTWKKADPARHVPTAEVVDTALCWGWVDSLPRARDAARTMLYISPRKAGSNWSRVNKEKVARLRAEGRMAPPGEAAVARAMVDGSWSALDAVEDRIVPPDLGAALAAAPGLAETWESWPRSVKRGALEQLLNAKRPETRAARIATIADGAARGERPFQWRKT